MKAAVIKQLGHVPQYVDFPDPIIQNKEQVLLKVKAASIKNLDKLRASGNHYASHKELPAVVGIDGVGVLENGMRVYAQGITGMIAEKAIIAAARYVKIPDNLDFFTAAALPNAVLGAAMAIKVRGEIKPRQHVLINGATGVTGQLAVQVARHYGANCIVATGRNVASLEKVSGLGADKIVSLTQEEDALVKELKQIHKETPIDLVIDYLWGKPTERVIQSLKVMGVTHKTRIVTVGSMAGENITLASDALRSNAIEILGSGLGSLSQADFQLFNKEILPEMLQLAADGKLKMELAIDKIENIENVWEKKIEPGKRLVVSIGD